MVFYPDNVPRATRLQQLVDSMVNMQTDIEDYSDRMDKRGKQIRPIINKVLKQQGIDSIDDLIEKSADRFSTDDERRFRQLIAAAKRNAKVHWQELVAGLLIGPAGGQFLSGENLLAIGRLGVRASGVEAMAEHFSTARNAGAAKISAVSTAEKLTKAAHESEKALKAEAAPHTSTAGTEAPKAVEEVSKAAQAASRVAVCLKLLGAIGFVATILVSAVELFQGAEQKTELIEAIHNAQPARLCIAYFAAEADDINDQLELCASYVQHVADKGPNDAVAKDLHDKLLKNITMDDALIDWKKMEKRLESEDKKSSSYYGDNDLDSTEVIRLARASEKDSRQRRSDETRFRS